jgi:hypothetical protein
MQRGQFGRREISSLLAAQLLRGRALPLRRRRAAFGESVFYDEDLLLFQTLGDGNIRPSSGRSCVGGRSSRAGAA